ncbi:MAG TPA: RNA polymerase sigma-70 factor [Ktedonobacterales bacterium]|nr:RNA polymerase sigma-70 factor [Ktedonobacterales bacterium]
MKDTSVPPTVGSQLEDVYERLRPLMFSIAYRMLGSVSEAEDVVQEAYLRLHRAVTQAGTTIESPKAFLTTVTTRLAIDALRAARARHETYVGVWLPEPLLTGAEPDPAEHAEMNESLSFAFLVLLRSLSPVERAVFLLREVFDYGYDEIAEIVRKSEENCRQIFARARKRIEAGKPRFDADHRAQQELAVKFFDAASRGDMTSLVNFLAEDAIFYGDGGGKAHAYPQPIYGRERVRLVLQSIFKIGRQLNATIQFTRINGQPGIMSFDAEGRLINVIALDIADGAVQAVRSIVNPDKLAHLGIPLSDVGRFKSKDA